MLTFNNVVFFIEQQQDQYCEHVWKKKITKLFKGVF